MGELERKTDCDDPEHRDVVYCIQCSDRDIAALEKKLSDAILQNQELQNSHQSLYKREKRLEAQVRLLDELCRRIIFDRACICNKPNHRCGTNQMLDDLTGILQCPRCQGTGAYLEADGDDPMPRRCECQEVK